LDIDGFRVILGANVNPPPPEEKEVDDGDGIGTVLFVFVVVVVVQPHVVAILLYIVVNHHCIYNIYLYRLVVQLLL
jgi:hypothetical protein